MEFTYQLYIQLASLTFCCFNDTLFFYYRMRSKSYMNQGTGKLVNFQESIVKGLKTIKS
jgi:hypothetical protein